MGLKCEGRDPSGLQPVYNVHVRGCVGGKGGGVVKGSAGPQSVLHVMTFSSFGGGGGRDEEICSQQGGHS